LTDLVGLGINGLVSFSSVPWRIVAALGVLMSLASFAVSVPTVWLKLFEDQAVHGTNALALLVLFMGGLQMLFFGLLGEYVNRIHKEVQNRPHYIVRRVLDVTAPMSVRDEQRSSSS
jgi:hypothetical protein